MRSAIDSFTGQVITAFIVPVAWSALGYFVINCIARLLSSTTREIYFRRLFFMFVALVIWFLFYPAFVATAFIGNGADPHHAERYALWLANRLGMAYGLQAIWAWVIVALIDRPKILPDKSAPSAGGAPGGSSRFSSGVAEL